MKTSPAQSHARRRAAARRGAALVEMAILCPLMLLLALATTDFGRVICAYSIVSNAARAGAEYAAVHGFTSYTQASWQSQVQQAVTNEMQAMPFYQSTNLQVTITAATDSAGINQTTVEVRYPFTTIISWAGIPATVMLDHSVEMRRRQ